MTQHPCPRCKRLIPAGIQYCETCRPIAEAQAAEARARKAEYRKRKSNTKYNARRDPRRQAFYNTAAWRTMSKAKLQSVGYKCEARLDGCTGLAVEVHHKRPIRTPDGWEHRLDWDNLEAVCIRCHNQRDGKTFRGGKPEEGVIDLKAVEAECRKESDVQNLQ